MKIWLKMPKSWAKFFGWKLIDEIDHAIFEPTGVEAAGRRRDGRSAGPGPLGFAVWADPDDADAREK